jgi:alcohol dehydrogenase class IV
VCAALLLHVTAANLDALRSRAPADRALERYDELARLLTAGQETSADVLPSYLGRMIADYGIPGLGAMGMRRQDFGTVIERTRIASSTKANPIALTDDELFGILDRAL